MRLTDERCFDTPEEAARFLTPLIDRPVETSRVEVAPHIRFAAETLDRGDTFTNSYTVSWRRPAAARIVVAEPPTSAVEFAREHGSAVTTTGGYFFLADRCRFRPRTLSLNLAIRDCQVLSLPVATQDALVSHDGVLSVVEVPARGELSIDGERLRWAGARTAVGGDAQEIDCFAYGNANCVIVHQADPRNGKVRVFQEDSRLTPEIVDRRWTDVGFARTPDGHFTAADRSDAGRLDIFAHDVVLRCPRALARPGAPMTVHTVGPLVPETVQGAISVGPALSYADPGSHPLNHDRSLGSFPLLRERPSTRLVFYTTVDGWQHLRLFDGRPGSATFPGLTLDEVVATVKGGGDVVSGCLLDSGHTSKINVRRDGSVHTFGNRHYLRWPTTAEPRYTWIPDDGRPAGSLIALG